MGSLFLVLKASTEHEQHANFVWNIAKAAEAQGHKVMVHVFGDGIYTLVPHLEGVGPFEVEEALNSRENLKAMYCNHNVIQRGLEKKLIENAWAASTPDASMQLLNSDRTVMISK